MPSILVVTNNPAAAQDILTHLGESHRTQTALGWSPAMALLEGSRFDFIFLDLSLVPLSAGVNGPVSFQPAWQQLFEQAPGSQLVVLCPQERIRQAVSAVKAGANDYLTYPLDALEIKLVLENLAEQQRLHSELNYLRDSVWREGLREAMRTNSPAMLDVLDKVVSVARTSTTVLLGGETGTGKSLTARLIHAYSNRAQGPFIALHCGAVPENLLESELFGHEKGAFTGAVRRKLGKFEIADQGTVFLDEIGTLSPAAQVKLLHVLQEKRFSRVGAEQENAVDVRIVAASNVDLKELCQKGDFRQDLYYRLNVFPIDLPPLRHRVEDIPLLAESFIERLNQSHGKGIRGVAPEAMQAMRRYAWPGNIRELENLLERAYVLAKEPLVTTACFPMEFLAMDAPAGAGGSSGVLSLAEVRRKALAEAEKRYLSELLALSQGSIKQTAALAGITTRQLHNLMIRNGLHKEQFKPSS